MRVKINYLDWDSTFFDKKIYKIETSVVSILSLKTILNEIDADLIYVFSSQEIDFIKDTDKIELVDIKVVLQKEISNNDLCFFTNSNIVEFTNNHNLEQIYKLAFLSGSYSRFKKDSKISNSKFKELYKLWVDNSINGKFAKKVFLYIENNKTLGFITVSFEKGIGNIGLIAVDENQQGKRIGSKLISRVESYLIENNIKKLRVPTQYSNSKALNFYKKNDFNILNKTYIYHFWK